MGCDVDSIIRELVDGPAYGQGERIKAGEKAEAFVEDRLVELWSPILHRQTLNPWIC